MIKAQTTHYHYLASNLSPIMTPDLTFKHPWDSDSLMLRGRLSNTISE